jgi:predicted permease
LLTDIRYALRQLRVNPGFTAVAVLTLALGIGATTAIFSVAYGVLLRPLPYPRPDRIVAVYELTTKGRPSQLADPNFADFRDHGRSFQAVAKYSEYVVSVSGAEKPTRTRAASVSHGFLSVLGVQPMLGRDFAASDDRQGAEPTLLVSHGYWKESLGSPRDLSGPKLKVDGALYSVIGVLPPGFRFPAGVDLWRPAGLEGENPSRTSHNYGAVGRLRDGVSVEQARQDVSAIARRIRDEAASERGDYLLADATVVPLRHAIAGGARSPLLVLLGAVGFLLLVACANVANLLLAQATARQRELAIRGALGAPRGRLVRQLLTEALLLSLLGGGVGVLAAFWGVAGLVALAPANLPRLDSVSINLPVLLFAVLVSTAVAAGLGAVTAAHATSGSLRAALEGGRGQAGSLGGQRAGRAIVAAQVAVTLVLVVGAGLLGRSLMKVLEVNPGFRVDGILAMDIALPWVEDPGRRAAQGRFFADLIAELERLPGVRRVGATSGLPLDGGHPDGMFLLMEEDAQPMTFERLNALFQQKERVGVADYCPVSEGYFQTLGIPLVRGRLFDARDGAGAPHVGVITESLARERWPGQDPIGRTIQFGNMDGDLRLITIVGIVGDTHEYGLDSPPRPTVYVDLLQRPRSSVSVAMRLDTDTQGVAAAARSILQRLDPELPARFRTLRQVLSASIAPRRFNVILIACFGAAALVLATTGVFGVIAYSVSRRTREIGVRAALGAEASDLRLMIVRQGLRTVLPGVAIGIAASLALTRTLESLLFGVTPTDPLTLAGMTLLLVAAGLLACYVPARRATKVDPVVALRQE